MDRIVLDDVRFDLDVPRLIERLHLEEGSEDAERVRVLAAEAQGLARPKALYGVAYIEERGDDFVVVDGVKLTSRVLRVNLEGTHRVFPYVATCGRELEEWSSPIDDVLESFWASAIKEAALRSAIAAMGEDLERRLQPGPTSDMNPGSLADWPMSEQRQLFTLAGDPQGAIGVELTDSYLMVPIKSVSGLRFPTETRFQSCQLCPREKCPGRRAPYDSELWRTRYRGG
ncbi:MAG: vitamin B12 dependent-methionine synthase activation domain-containing protein [Anaerolineae bacterium]|nr:vitamin B12 dependent-methionine synthase activation domain-containing protein [Anaerolineae bacterium]